MRGMQQLGQRCGVSALEGAYGERWFHDPIPHVSRRALLADLTVLVSAAAVTSCASP